jgi:Ca2+-binding EF-hand superfamily protein
MILNDIHFYGKTEVNLKNTDGENFAAGSLFKLLDSESKKFKSYTELAKYASSIGVNVINASPNSMIDSFDRL